MDEYVPAKKVYFQERVFEMFFGPVSIRDLPTEVDQWFSNVVVFKANAL